MFSAALAALSLVQAAPADPALEQDLRCVAVLSIVLGQMPEERRGAATAGVMYFIGRAEGRRPGINLETELVRIVGPLENLDALQPDLQRCSKELETQGAALQAMGKALQARGQ